MALRDQLHNIEPSFTICELSFTYVFVFKLIWDGEYTQIVDS